MNIEAAVFRGGKNIIRHDLAIGTGNDQIRLKVKNALTLFAQLQRFNACNTVIDAILMNRRRLNDLLAADGTVGLRYGADDIPAFRNQGI